MSVSRRPRGWRRPTPLVEDALVAVVVFVTVLLPLASGSAPGDRLELELTPAAVGLLGLACLVLVARRRAPLPVWAITTFIGLVACVEADGATPVYLPAVIALGTLASRTGVPTTMLAATASALLPVAVIAVVGDQGVVESFVFGLTPWSGAAAMAGIAVRSQRAVVAAALDRAEVAEARQEEEAQRRVAEERLRIARDLHDVVAHHIAVVNVQAGVAQHLLRSDPDRAAEAISHVREASRTVLDEVPVLLGLLRTGEDEQPTAPTPTLGRAADLVEQARRSGLDVSVSVTGRPPPLSASADVAAFRVLQESLTNAARHGRGRAEVSLHHEVDGTRLSVRNLRADRADAGAVQRHGLVGMIERVTASGGTVSAGPDGPDGRDWLVEAWLPADLVGRAG